MNAITLSPVPGPGAAVSAGAVWTPRTPWTTAAALTRGSLLLLGLLLALAAFALATQPHLRYGIESRA